jgi:hypothetical protein
MEDGSSCRDLNIAERRSNSDAEVVWVFKTSPRSQNSTTARPLVLAEKRSPAQAKRILGGRCLVQP